MTSRPRGVSQNVGAEAWKPAGEIAEALDELLEDVRTVADLGRHFGGCLYETEVRYLIADEWAVEADDVLWRRTKEGLHMTESQRLAFARWLAELRPNFT